MRSPWTHSRAVLLSLALTAGCSEETSPPRLEPFAEASLALLAVQDAELVAADGAPSDLFGLSVALSGDTALVGAPYEDDAGTDAGAAYVFVKANGVWKQEAKLVASDASPGKWFGQAVALAGDRAVVGAPRGDGKVPTSGAAYVFVRANGVWKQEAKLVAGDGAAADGLGTSVAMAGEVALVGAPEDDDKGLDAGAAFVFVRAGGTWVQENKLLAADGAAGDRFGAAVALAGQTALVGAPEEDDNGANAGAAYVYVQSGTIWFQQGKLTSGDQGAGEAFGAAVAVAGDVALVGAPFTATAAPEAGAAYVFLRSGLTWAGQAQFAAEDGASGDHFGTAVALSAGVALVGAPLMDAGGVNTGAAYVYTGGVGGWFLGAKLTAADGSTGDTFGYAVAVTGGDALVGAYLGDKAGTNAGAAYVFGFVQENGEACGETGECASGFCVEGVCCESACEGGVCQGGMCVLPPEEDAGTEVDAGMDAGTEADAGMDAGAEADAGMEPPLPEPPEAVILTGGCACNAAGNADAGASPLVLAAAALLRRRRRPAAPAGSRRPGHRGLV